MPMPLCGILNIHKPAGMTSRQAVDRVKRLTWPAKAGHAGTLDPLATGVLVVCVDAATRWIAYVQRMPKRYTGTFLLGRQSPTEDTEGDVVELPNAPVPTLEQIVTVAGRFVGRIEQQPPAFSALKIAGQPAYKLARKGMLPQLAARPVQIHGIEVVSYQYPELVLDVSCGSGTYIRSLGRDLAKSLGSSAVMSALVRSAIGRFSLEEAVDPRELTADNLPQLLQPTLRALDYLPRIQLSADELTQLRHGLAIERSESRAYPEGHEIVALGPDGELVGILTPGLAGQLRTLRNMPMYSQRSANS
jgi:tRNA pseudouridine55 synthase